MYVGFPIGGSIAGLVATPLMSSFGWQSVFIVGGVLPLLALLMVWLALPESIPFALARNRTAEGIASLVSRIDPSYVYRSGDRFVFEEHRPDRASLGALFSSEWRSRTVLLWLIAFANLLVLYSLINWLPSLLHQAGLSLAQANFGAVAFNIGGIAGALLLSFGVDRWGPLRILSPAYAGAAVVALLLAQPSDIGSALALTVLAGAGVIGTQFCINALASVLYPTAIRASGVGWMLGFGRIGSISGPLLWGIALGSGMAARDVLALSAVPLLVCCAAVVLLSLVLRRAPT
jgi:AAHS family 4-hydroxybenzoate transporter-like MFS transporter